MVLKDYGYDLSRYKKSDFEMLKQGKKKQLIGIILMLISLFFFPYGGFIVFIIGIALIAKSRKYKKIIAQRAYVAEIIKKIETPPSVYIIPDTTAKEKRHKSVSSMRMIDFTNIRLNTQLSKIFPLVVIDVETTGLDRSDDRIVEISAYKYENNFTPTQRFSTLINPKMPIPAEATKINNITNDMVSSAPYFEQVAAQLQDFINGCNIAGYNVRFDLEFLYMAGIKFSEDVLYFDVYEIAKKKIKESEVANYRLQTVCKRLGVDTALAHRSASDAYATGEVLETLVMRDRG
ncbi:MAG: 3'-5' exonuclease [Faecalibacterium sp.]|nr:3'-5' exonuclease [Ruminococcus sp.]MCM1393226.1 3'-5' exonuclease [Ruminococcus sp.]MCM1485770.1 3'-5' exonuclease [Faecalibacterium sp.]